MDRPLPWRGERDPYRVLVAEVMLQQTQASRVAKAYPVFLRRFPSARRLAAAPASEALRAWGDLGYNRRALNLWRACRTVVEPDGFPRTVEGLQALPGIGPYTARAVASFSFGAPVGVVDANVRRVLTRTHGLAADVRPATVQAIADRLVPRDRSGAWNQAMIDLGALVCRSRTPSCGVCALRRRCAWAGGHRPSVGRPGPRARVKESEPPFETTTRYVRGRIVAELRRGNGSLDVRALRRRVSVEEPRFVAALASLKRDGLATRTGRRVALGDGEVSGRASAARRRRQRRTVSRRG